MVRKTPIRHVVSSHNRSNAHVDRYVRGKGKPDLNDSDHKSNLKLIRESQERNTVLVTYPSHTVSYRMAEVETSKIDSSENAQENVNGRAEYFMDQYRRGRQIPPILVHQKPDGRYEVIDGHARLEAYKRLGVKKIPVVENLLAGVAGAIGSGVGKVAAAGYTGAKAAYQGYSAGRAEAKASEESRKQRIQEAQALAEEQRAESLRQVRARAAAGNPAAQAYLRKYHNE